MRLGYCLDLDFLQNDGRKTLFDMVTDAGFDYVELSLSGISALSGSGISQLLSLINNRPRK